MKQITIDDIRAWAPCYDPSRYLAEDWKGDALDILRLDAVPPQDRLWVVCHEEIVDAKILQRFALWCAKQVEYLLEDPRSINALEVAEQYLSGAATHDELKQAWAAAKAAAEAAAKSAAETHAWVAAEAAAWAAAKAAAWATAWAAAWAAAEVAAEAAAWAAAWAAAEVAAWATAEVAAWATTQNAEMQKQLTKLIEMLEESVKNADTNQQN